MNVSQIASIAEAKARKVVAGLRTTFDGTTTDAELLEVLNMQITDDTSNLMRICYTGFDQLNAIAGEQLWMITNVVGDVAITAIDTREENDLTTAALTVTTDAGSVKVSFQGVLGSTINWVGYYELLTALNDSTL